MSYVPCVSQVEAFQLSDLVPEWAVGVNIDYYVQDGIDQETKKPIIKNIGSYPKGYIIGADVKMRNNLIVYVTRKSGEYIVKDLSGSIFAMSKDDFENQFVSVGME